MLELAAGLDWYVSPDCSPRNTSLNFFSGFVTPEGARAMKLMFEKGRELKRQFPDDDKKYR